jgi:type VI secretion system protein ImpK
MSSARSLSLASIFQEPLTAIVRVRCRLHSVADADVFRKQMRHLLQAPMEQARSAGYDNGKIQSAVFAVVALLDESVLNLQDPAFAQWARRPLQEELFGGHLAGETFFRNLRSYLAEADSMQLAEVLELHCLCLLLGYRGRYALGDSGELYATLRVAHERISRIRGGGAFGMQVTAEPSTAAPARDNRWTRRLFWLACTCCALVVIAFCAYSLLLASGAAALHHAAFPAAN